MGGETAAGAVGVRQFTPGGEGGCLVVRLGWDDAKSLDEYPRQPERSADGEDTSRPPAHRSAVAELFVDGGKEA